MKVYILVLIVFFIIQNTQYIKAQGWEIAPEVWSEPVLMDSLFEIPWTKLVSPSLSKSFDTIYYCTGSIYSSIKSDTGWSEPKRLDAVSPPLGGVRRYSSSISKNGKRLYLSAWGGYGGWDLYYSDWSDSLKDWTIPINMGSKINTQFHETYLYEISEDSIYVIQDSQHPSFYIFDDIKNEWCKKDSFWYHPIGGPELHGLSITKNKQKLYFGYRRWGEERGINIAVTYWDNNTEYWGKIYDLNINSFPTEWQGETRSGVDLYPWVSEDGKILVFSSNRINSFISDSSDGTVNLYISYLLVDEKGDSITNVKINKNGKEQINSFDLFQNYPNPFNPSTIISYNLLKEGKVVLNIYNSIGQKIATLVNQNQSKGKYRIKFNPSENNLGSGTYYYQLYHNGNYSVKKMILLK